MTSVVLIFASLQFPVQNDWPHLLSSCPCTPQLEFGVIHHCTEERLYTGRRGQGAFCNGQRLQVSRETGGALVAHPSLFHIEKCEWKMPNITISCWRFHLLLGTSLPWWSGILSPVCISVSLFMCPGGSNSLLLCALTSVIPKATIPLDIRVGLAELNEQSRPRAEHLWTVCHAHR